MPYTIMPCFDRFPNEGNIIGRLLAGYGELELELCQCMAVINDDLDAAIRAMFKLRGEQKRISAADSLVKNAYAAAGLTNAYQAAIDDMQWCRMTRNQYAHCHWYDSVAEGVCFYDLENLAAQTDPIQFITTNRHSVDLGLLKEQEAFFKYVQRCFWYLKWAYSVYAGRAIPPAVSLPSTMARPPRHK